MALYQDEIEWKDLLRKPEKLFGYSYLYFLGAVTILGLLYVARMSDAGKNAVAAANADSTDFVQDIPLQMPRIIPPVDVLQAGISSPEAINRGRDLFKANCASCHGDNGRGDGPAGLAMNPRPRNFHVLTGWTNGSTTTQIYKTLEEGIVKNGMASFNYLFPADRFALIHYVRTFAGGLPADSPDALKTLDAAYQLSKGTSVAGQMPIKKAAQIVENESRPAVHRLETMIDSLRASSDPAALLFHRVAQNEQKAISSLMHLNKSLTASQLTGIITADPVQTGFKAEVARLTAAEWTTLHRFAAAMSRGGER